MDAKIMGPFRVGLFLALYLLVGGVMANSNSMTNPTTTKTLSTKHQQQRTAPLTISNSTANLTIIDFFHLSNNTLRHGFEPFYYISNLFIDHVFLPNIPKCKNGLP